MAFMETLQSNADDRELWRRLQKGEPQALTALFRRHYAMLYDYGFKLAHQSELVQDSIQEVFAYIWEKHAAVSAAESVRAYLLASLRRHVLNALTQHRQRQQTLQEFDILESQEYFSPEDFLIVQETEADTRRALKKGLQKIPPRLREALYLKTYNGLSYREIGSLMQVSPQVARNYVCEAMQRLRNLLTTQSS